MAKLESVEGIGDKYAQALRDAGVSTTQALLDKGATPKGRKAIAADSGIREKLVLEWVNHVDLFRIKGVGEEYADLLEEAGVDTVVELKRRNPRNLLKKMEEVNQAKELVRQLPSQAQVEDWVNQAKGLNRVIKY
jgi:predicted flap endonuclease-1-like 5' DNA nuclease